ncbi:hypothetical protein V6N13_137763 [Hibiscus sabdariffa]|uniref:Uncharacterized protein n=1 Tax=Hibiscus sabdariffa TaxID=183260 RepID=A0ABR2DMI5_9ROSI
MKPFVLVHHELYAWYLDPRSDKFQFETSFKSPDLSQVDWIRAVIFKIRHYHGFLTKEDAWNLLESSIGDSVCEFLSWILPPWELHAHVFD